MRSYLPHDAVLQISAGKRKLPVVFDASRSSGQHPGLKSFLLPGPPLQNDLALVLTAWRRHRVVFTADIIKMFRQIHVHSEDQELQRILWPTKYGDDPTEFRLTTVTYGTPCAPFLAIRTLIRLTKDEGARFPAGAQCLLHNTYVDDIRAGDNNAETASNIKEQLVSLSRCVGIELDKWAKNTPDLLPSDSHAPLTRETDRVIEIDDCVKTLGLRWRPSMDSFGFEVDSNSHLGCTSECGNLGVFSSNAQELRKTQDYV